MKISKAAFAVAVSICSGFAALAAPVYQYDFVVTNTSLSVYPVSDYAGAYIDLTAPSGTNVDYQVAIADWYFPTGQGTLTSANSIVYSIVGLQPVGLSWNSTTITRFANPIHFGLSPQAYPDVAPEAGAIVYTYALGNNTYTSDSIFGYWQAEPVPEPNLPTLALASLAGFFLIRRRAFSI
jgi:hypothetical protein